jgi:hypothetical protein
MTGIAAEMFHLWTEGRSPIEARVSVYERIRDIPYAIIPELIHSERYLDILVVGRGSCTPKHFLLCDMYHRLGMTVLFVGYPFRWDEVEVDYPAKLRRLAESMPTSYHLACKVEIDGALVLVDATLDLAVEKLGLPVNREWDGVSDTQLPMKPYGGEEYYHPAEASQIEARTDDKSLEFYRELNHFLEKAAGR